MIKIPTETGSVKLGTIKHESCVGVLQAAEAAKAAAAAQAEGEDGETVDGSQEKEEDVIGVPHIVVDVHERSSTPSQKVMNSGRLPTVEEVIMMITNKYFNNNIVIIIIYLSYI